MHLSCWPSLTAGGTLDVGALLSCVGGTLHVDVGAHAALAFWEGFLLFLPSVKITAFSYYIRIYTLPTTYLVLY